MLPEESFFDPRNKQSKNAPIEDTYKGYDDLIASSFNDLFSGMSKEANKEKENDKLAQEFGKAVVEESEKERSPDNLEELMSSPWKVELPPKTKPSEDLRYNPDLDDLFGVPQLSSPLPANTSKNDSGGDVGPMWIQSLNELINNLAVKDFDFRKPESKLFPERGDESYDDRMFELDKGFGDLHNSLTPKGPDLGEYGPFLPNKEGEQDPNEPGQGALAIGGGFDSCCEMLGPLFERLSESITSLSEAVNKFADTLDPKEKLTEEEKAEKEYSKETGSIWEMFKSGFAHDFKSDKKDTLEYPGKTAKSFGQDMGAGAGKGAGIAELLGAKEGGNISMFAAAIGGAAGGVTSFYETIRNSVDTVVDWNETLIRSNFQFAEYSAAMAKAQMEMEVRDIAYSQQRGDARSESAEGLAESWSELKTAFAPIADFFANTFNEILTVINKVLKFLLETFGFTGDGAGSSSLSAGLVSDAMLGATAEAYGAPARMRIFGR